MFKKANVSKECDIRHCWYFLDKAFKFVSDAWNGCINVLVMSINLNDIAVLNI